MKWKEFKAAVEAKGVNDEDEIGYIDVCSESSAKEIDAFFHLKVPSEWNIIG